MTIQITDTFGNFRTDDYTDEEMASLTAEQHTTVLSIGKVAGNVKHYEQAAAENDAEIVKLAKLASTAEEKYRASFPPWDRIDELRRITENQRRAALGQPPLPPVTIEGDPKLAEKVRKLDAQIATANAKSREIKDQLKEARSHLAELVRVWQSTHAKTPAQEYREHLQRQQEYYAKIARGEVETYDQVEHHMSHLDACMSSGRRGSANQINHGFGRKHSRRGTQVRPKLPSQR
jgi:hypothetical protein